MLALSKERYFTGAVNRSLLFSTVRKNLQMPSYSKAPGVFLSKDNQAASSQPSQFRRVCVQDSCSVILPFVRVGTHPTRNFARYVILEVVSLKLSISLWSSDYIFPNKIRVLRVVSEAPSFEKSNFVAC